MVALIVFVGVLFVACAVALILRAATLPRARVAAQLRQIQAYGFNSDLPGEYGARPDGHGLERLAGRVGRFTEHVVPPLTPLTRTQLVAGGVTGIDPEAFHGYRTMAAVGIPALFIVEGVLAGKFSAILILLIIIIGPLIWAVPASTIRRRAQARLDQIDRALPELVDVITATIDAGLGFGASLQLIADRFDGPLGEELRLTLHEQNMGLTTDRALANMLERCETPSVRAFVRAVEQGSTLGISISQMMRSVATECRSRRREAAHELVQEAPVKLLIPLVLMIFPALLVVLLYPALHAVFNALA